MSDNLPVRPDTTDRTPSAAGSVRSVPAGPRVPRREFAVLKAHLLHGSHKAGAHSLGIAETTSRQRMSALQRRLGVRTIGQAVFVMRRELEREVLRT